MTESVQSHRAAGPIEVRVAVLTVSDTRTFATDGSGSRIVEMLLAAGHKVVERGLVRDDVEAIRSFTAACAARADIDALVVTGGTGISPRDQTPEAIEPLWTKRLPGYGELLRMLSHAEIGPACLLSRAEAGLVGQLAVFTLPGSRAAIELGMNAIILPELKHILGLIK